MHCSARCIPVSPPIFPICPLILPVGPRNCDIEDKQCTGVPVNPPVTKRLAGFVRGPLDPCSKIQPPVLSCEPPPLDISILSNNRWRDRKSRLAGRPPPKKESIRIHCNTKEANVRHCHINHPLSFRPSPLSHLDPTIPLHPTPTIHIFATSNILPSSVILVPTLSIVSNCGFHSQLIQS